MMFERACTMVGGPLDDEILVMPNAGKRLIMQFEDFWILYVRSGDDCFRFVSQHETIGEIVRAASRLGLDVQGHSSGSWIPSGDGGSRGSRRF